MTPNFKLRGASMWAKIRRSESAHVLASQRPKGVAWAFC